MMNRFKPVLFVLIILFLLFEIVFSFKRHYYFPIDGDLPAIVLPDVHYATVMHDPFAMNVLLHDSVYSAPNRFFAHAALSVYFNHAPQFFQLFVSPVNSIYVACGFAKTVAQFIMIYLLSVYITGKRKIWSFDLLLAASLIAPLFQIFGYNFQMGIIDHSITYSFFYAVALLWVLMFYLPFFNAVMGRNAFHFRSTKIMMLFLLALVLSFNGPLNAPVIIIICPFALLYFFIHYFKRMRQVNFISRIKNAIIRIPPHLLYVFSFASIVCAYSVYAGKNNSENLWESIPLWERYARLPKGFYDQFTCKPGMNFLLVMILINTILLAINKTDQVSKLFLKLLKWIGILSLIYILLLPLGGYRSYHPYIIRMDTIMPVTIALILYYGLTTFHILKHVPFRLKEIYYVVVVVFIFIFVNADTKVEKQNRCEQAALNKFAQSADTIVFMENDCSILSWNKTLNYKDSEVKTELLRRWNVIHEKKYFYQK